MAFQLPSVISEASVIQALANRLRHRNVQSTITQMLKVKASVSPAQLAILAMIKELKFLHLANVANIAYHQRCHLLTP